MVWWCVMKWPSLGSMICRERVSGGYWWVSPGCAKQGYQCQLMLYICLICNTCGAVAYTFFIFLRGPYLTQHIQLYYPSETFDLAMDHCLFYMCWGKAALSYSLETFPVHIWIAGLRINITNVTNNMTGWCTVYAF